MKRSFLLLASLLFFGIAVTSCKKESVDDSTIAAQDQSIAENESNKVFEAVDNSLNSGSGKTGKYEYLPECAQVSIDTISPTKKVVIDFGSTGCVCSNWDGKTRKGKIIATFTGRYKDAGTIITYKTENYFVDSYEFKIEKIVHNKGTNSNGNPNWDITVKATIVAPEGIITWNSMQNREWTKGWKTKFLWIDDEYSITSPTPTTGISRNGENFVANITKPVIVKIGCIYRFVAGTIDVTVGTKAKRTLDLGNGACDKTYTITVNGKTRTYNK